MAWDAAEIERIVRQVAARMQPESPATQPANTAGLVLESKVVSLAQLDGRLGAARQITVRRDAVITPAARDWLREKQIAVHVADAVANPKSASRLAVGVADTKFDPTGVLRTAAIGSVQRLANTGLATVVEELCDTVAKDGSLGLLFTEAPATGLCLANRRRGVRAIEAKDLRSLADGMSAVGANLLVLNPSGAGALAIRRLIEQFCGGEPRSCPESLRKYLG